MGDYPLLGIKTGDDSDSPTENEDEMFTSPSPADSVPTESTNGSSSPISSSPFPAPPANRSSGFTQDCRERGHVSEHDLAARNLAELLDGEDILAGEPAQPLPFLQHTPTVASTKSLSVTTAHTLANTPSLPTTPLEAAEEEDVGVDGRDVEGEEEAEERYVDNGVVGSTDETVKMPTTGGEGEAGHLNENHSASDYRDDEESIEQGQTTPRPMENRAGERGDVSDEEHDEAEEEKRDLSKAVQHTPDEQEVDEVLAHEDNEPIEEEEGMDTTDDINDEASEASAAEGIVEITVTRGSDEATTQSDGQLVQAAAATLPTGSSRSVADLLVNTLVTISSSNAVSTASLPPTMSATPMDNTANSTPSLPDSPIESTGDDGLEDEEVMDVVGREDGRDKGEQLEEENEEGGEVPEDLESSQRDRVEGEVEDIPGEEDDDTEAGDAAADEQREGARGLDENNRKSEDPVEGEDEEQEDFHDDENADEMAPEARAVDELFEAAPVVPAVTVSRHEVPVLLDDVVDRGEEETRDENVEEEMGEDLTDEEVSEEEEEDGMEGVEEGVDSADMEEQVDEEESPLANEAMNEERDSAETRENGRRAASSSEILRRLAAKQTKTVHPSKLMKRLGTGVAAGASMSSTTRVLRNRKNGKVEAVKGNVKKNAIVAAPRLTRARQAPLATSATQRSPKRKTQKKEGRARGGGVEKKRKAGEKEKKRKTRASKPNDDIRYTIFFPEDGPVGDYYFLRENDKRLKSKHKNMKKNETLGMLWGKLIWKATFLHKGIEKEGKEIAARHAKERAAKVKADEKDRRARKRSAIAREKERQKEENKRMRDEQESFQTWEANQQRLHPQLKVVKVENDDEEVDSGYQRPPMDKETKMTLEPLKNMPATAIRFENQKNIHHVLATIIAQQPLMDSAQRQPDGSYKKGLYEVEPLTTHVFENEERSELIGELYVFTQKDYKRKDFLLAPEDTHYETFLGMNVERVVALFKCSPSPVLLVQLSPYEGYDERTDLKECFAAVDYHLAEAQFGKAVALFNVQLMKQKEEEGKKMRATRE